MKGFITIFAVLGGLIYLIGHGSSSSSDAATTAQAAPTRSAHITMLRGPSSDNKCSENDGDARIYVTITLRNSGNAAGTVNPWATFDYSDGGHSEETYLENFGHSIRVPAHTEVDASFYHTFNPQQHSMIRCAGYTDLGGSSTGYYLPG